MPEDNENIEEMDEDSATTEGSEDISGDQETTAPGPSEPEEDWRGKATQFQEHNRALNRKLVELQRQINSQKGSPYQVDEEQSQEYATNLRLATADIRDGLERLIPLYPELPADVVSQLRRNPLAWAGSDFYTELNPSNALLEIEKQMLALAESVGAQQPQGQPSAQGRQPMKQVRPSQAPRGNEPASEEDPSEDPWTMPMDKLEEKVNKLRARQN